MPPRGASLFPYTTLFRSGETCDIGRNVKLYQGVTLGALSFTKDDDGGLVHGSYKRHPTLQDDVVVYANATILRSEEHTSELQSLRHLVCRLLLEKKKEAQ